MVAIPERAATPTKPPQKTRVEIYEVDRKAKLQEGINPNRIDSLRIAYVQRVDARGEAARVAAETRMGRKCSSVRHGEDLSVSVMFNKGAV